MLRLYEALLTLRRTAAALYDPAGTVRVEVLDDDTLALRRDTGDQQHALLAIVRLRGGGSVTLPRGTGEVVSLDDRFALALSTESPAFASDSAPLDLTIAADVAEGALRTAGRDRADRVIRFTAAGRVAVVLQHRARRTGRARPHCSSPLHHEVRSRHSKGACACQSHA